MVRYTPQYNPCLRVRREHRTQLDTSHWPSLVPLPTGPQRSHAACNALYTHALLAYKADSTASVCGVPSLSVPLLHVVGGRRRCRKFLATKEFPGDRTD